MLDARMQAAAKARKYAAECPQPAENQHRLTRDV